MTQDDAERILDLEESADGVELFRPPGEELQLEKARDQAETSGWIPEKVEPSLERNTGLETARVRRDKLGTALQHLEMTAARPAAEAGWTEALESSLDQLQAALEAHVREVEDTGGLLDEILDVAPRLAYEVQVIEKEHEELRNSLATAQQQLKADTAADVPAIRRRVIALLARLDTHRQRGSDLVYEAYNVDIAAAD